MLRLTLFGFVVLISACSTTTPQEGEGVKIPLYANFCGPLHPDPVAAQGVVIEGEGKLSESSVTLIVEREKKKVVHWLEIPAKDAVDAVCKAHDICYIRYPHKHKACDNTMLARIEALESHYTIAGRTLFFDMSRFSLKHDRNPPANVKSDYKLISSAISRCEFVSATIREVFRPTPTGIFAFLSLAPYAALNFKYTKEALIQAKQTLPIPLVERHSLKIHSQLLIFLGFSSGTRTNPTKNLISAT